GVAHHVDRTGASHVIHAVGHLGEAVGGRFDNRGVPALGVDVADDGGQQTAAHQQGCAEVERTAFLLVVPVHGDVLWQSLCGRLRCIVPESESREKPPNVRLRIVYELLKVRIIQNLPDLLHVYATFGRHSVNTIDRGTGVSNMQYYPHQVRVDPTAHDVRGFSRSSAASERKPAVVSDNLYSVEQCDSGDDDQTILWGDLFIDMRHLQRLAQATA